jgi:hypothetical protein
MRIARAIQRARWICARKLLLMLLPFPVAAVAAIPGAKIPRLLVTRQ